MSVYADKDIKTADDGELDISSGDIELATPQQSHRQLIINYLSTNKGDFRGMRSFGWPGDKYIGSFNTPTTIARMQNDITVGLKNINDFSFGDIEINVFTADEESVGIVSVHNGEFMDEDGEIEDSEIYLGWKYPLTQGRIVRYDDTD